ncbi:unnamed protein product [Caenorhabditis bovis]|uniref:F-box domain-containing protein n=1 Tax=Caenorhabditis bovis TaxID=2654633 RepID=A0A8S1FBR8_9PELO|nr:unnamed protein product [Caenorhabditis bovis]
MPEAVVKKPKKPKSSAKKPKGLEPAMKRWDELPSFIQTSVIEKLPFETRYSLSKCSKKMMEIEKVPPVFIHRFELLESELFKMEPVDAYDKAIIVTVDFVKVPSHKSIPIIFLKTGNDTEVSREYIPHSFRSDEVPTIYENTDYIEKSLELFEKLMKRSRNRVVELSIDMPSWDISKSAVKEVNCEMFQIRFNNIDQLNQGLEMLGEQVKNLRAFFKFEGAKPETKLVPKEILEHKQIQNAEILFIRGNCQFTEELFMSLKGKELNFSSSTISDAMYNKFILRWIDGGGVDDFQKLSAWYPKEFNEQIILKNVMCKLWDDKFKKDNERFLNEFFFAYGKDSCYQVLRKDGRQSATIAVSEQEVLFLVTGKFCEKTDRMEYYCTSE